MARPRGKNGTKVLLYIGNSELADANILRGKLTLSKYATEALRRYNLTQKNITASQQARARDQVRESST